MNDSDRQKMHKVRSLVYAIDHYIKSYDAVPHFPANKETIDRYLKGYEENLNALKELLNEQ